MRGMGLSGDGRANAFATARNRAFLMKSIVSSAYSTPYTIYGPELPSWLHPLPKVRLFGLDGADDADLSLSMKMQKLAAATDPDLVGPDFTDTWSDISGLSWGPQTGAVNVYTVDPTKYDSTVDYVRLAITVNSFSGTGEVEIAADLWSSNYSMRNLGEGFVFDISNTDLRLDLTSFREDPP